MTQKEKQLLLQDLCARLPYGVKVDVNFYYATKELSYDLLQDFITDEKSIRPYLRPMSSMTEEEQKIFDDFCVIDEEAWKGNGVVGFINQSKIFEKAINFLNLHYFDYRGLIERGLALEAPEGMYKNKRRIEMINKGGKK